ncbi:MAG: prepilin-type N-terminal cleavage/methylation domain-containing protein [Acidobacteriota bacterium]
MNKRSTKEQQAAGFTLIELLIVIVIIGILATLSTLYLISSRRAANGASAVESMRVIFQAQASYSAGVGNQNYGDGRDLFRQEFIDSSLAAACSPGPTSGETSVGNDYVAISPQPKSGFNFIFTVTPASGGTAASFRVLGRPFVDAGVSRSGDRTFYIDTTGVLRVSNGPDVPANLSSPALD